MVAADGGDERPVGGAPQIGDEAAAAAEAADALLQRRVRGASPIAERASGADYHDLVRARVSEPAGMSDTDFLRSDELPGRTALGYLSIDGTWRTNVFHLSVHWHRRLRDLLHRRRPPSSVAGAVRRPPRRRRHGGDTGVACFSTHDPDRALTYSVVSNTADGADPVHDRLAELPTDPT